ncbi:MAG: bifunctional DNA primase/polymerase [Litoricola sp.]|nr:bifunctional DNA primase/polymerase [Litorivicinus sp.]
MNVVSSSRQSPSSGNLPLSGLSGFSEPLHIEFPFTWTSQTLSGGTHFMFEYPEDVLIRNSAGKFLGKDIDVRGVGGYIIFPGSKSSAGEYTFVEELDPSSVSLEKAPEELLTLLTSTRKPESHLPATAPANAALKVEKGQYLTFDEAVQQIASPLGLSYVDGRWEGYPCPACHGGTKDRFTLRKGCDGLAWLICNQGCSQSDMWKALADTGLLNQQVVEAIRTNILCFPERGRKNQPIMTVANTKALLAHLGAVARYDVIGKSEEILIPGMVTSFDNRLESSLTDILSEATKHGLPTAHIDRMVVRIADENPYNPVLQWIESIPWDGVYRFPLFLQTLQTDDPQLAAVLLRKWMLTAIAALTTHTGIAAQGVLVLQGAQGAGKTRWFQSLCPAPVDQYFLSGHILDPRNKDSVLAATRAWIVELGEVDATFRKADIAALKSFLTNHKDVIRKPYGRKESELPRRTIFGATVNELGPLNDETGNRRFWTLRCQSVDADHGINMQQLWAELLVAHQAGETIFLTSEELDRLNKSNKISEAINPYEELIATCYCWDQPANRHLTSTEICEEIGAPNPSKYVVNAVAKAVRKQKGIVDFDRKHDKSFTMPIMRR